MRYAFYILFILILIPGRSLAQQADSDVLRMKAALANGAYDRVSSINLNPSDSEARAQYFLTKGRAEYELGSIMEAENYLMKVEDLYPGRASYDLARLYSKSDDKDRMFYYLEKHLTSGYKKTEKEIMLDPAFSGLDNDREWIRFWSREWFDQDEELLSEAKYRLSQNDMEGAFWDDLLLEKADSPQILVEVAGYYAALGDNRKADQLFRQALSIDPYAKGVKIKYAALLLERSRYNDALNIYNELITADPYDIRNYILYTSALLKSGQSGRAMSEMSKLADLGIDASVLNIMMAREIVDKDPDQAIQYLDPLLSASPSVEAFNIRAMANTSLNNIQNAISDYSMSLDINPKQPNVYFYRAELRYKMGDKRGACYDWQKALTLGHRKAQDMLYKYCR